MFFSFVIVSRSTPISDKIFVGVNLEFIKTISLNDMYTFIAHCQTELHAAAGTRARKIVSIRQFWKYLKTKAHLIDNNIAEELETPKLPKRIPKYLSLEESVRLLIQCEKSARDHSIITIFLNCALRLSELASLNIDQVDNEVISVVGKGNKERRIYLTPAAKKSIYTWIQIRRSLDVPTDALFISRNSNHDKAIQNVVKKYVVASGLDSKSISTHKLRHYVESQVMGSVTRKCYYLGLFHENTPHNTFYSHKDFSHLIKSPSSSHFGSPSGTKSGYAFSIAFRFISLSALA